MNGWSVDKNHFIPRSNFRASPSKPESACAGAASGLSPFTLAFTNCVRIRKGSCPGAG
jgi:hypothetical protein